MCGRFTLTVSADRIQAAFPWLQISEPIAPRYNIAPTQPVPVVPNDGERRLRFFRWGLIPSWAEDPRLGQRMINARAETLRQRPAFRTAFRLRRCLVLADGFYEWRQEPDRKRKIPYYVRLKSGDPFGFAGLWELWESPEGEPLYSCTIITTEPNELVKPLHNRMPVILPAEAHGIWLDPEPKAPDELQRWLKPYPAEEMEAYPVSTLVNNPAADVPECVRPVA